MLERGGKQQTENPTLNRYLSQPAMTPTDAPRLQRLAAALGRDNCLNLRDETGKTLLFHAVVRCDISVVRFLCNPATGKSGFGCVCEVADTRLGAAICRELRALRRRIRPLYKRTVERF